MAVPLDEGARICHSPREFQPDVGETMTNFGTLLFTWTKGRKVGTDQAGNAYYTERSVAKGRRTKRWAMKALTAVAMSFGATPIFSMRATAPAALLV